jgi:hypothetical protein
MLKLRRRLDLGEKALGAKCRCEIRMKDLDCNIALVPEVMCEINGRHAAHADLANDAIPVFEGTRKARNHVAHLRPNITE